MKNSKKWKQQLNADSTEWLLNSNLYTAYNTRKYLLGANITPSVQKQYVEQLIKQPNVKQLLKNTQDWMPKASGRNNDPKLSYFGLKTLADLGLNSEVPEIQRIIKEAESHYIDDFYACRGIPPERPKRGEKFIKPDPEANVWHTAPCNSPVITYALLALGYKNSHLTKSVDALADKWKTTQGWFCHYHFVNGQYKKLNEGCPIAGLMALDVFSMISELKESEVAKNAFRPLEFHWEYGKTLYYFGRSKKFWTMKYPFVWYNALYLADVLTRFDFLKNSPLVKELIDWILKSQDAEGKFKPTSIFMNYKGWDFSNKKEASPWITYLCYKILKQWN